MELPILHSVQPQRWCVPTLVRSASGLVANVIFFSRMKPFFIGVILDPEVLRVNAQQVNSGSSGKFLKLRAVRTTGKIGGDLFTSRRLTARRPTLGPLHPEAIACIAYPNSASEGTNFTGGAFSVSEISDATTENDCLQFDRLTTDPKKTRWQRVGGIKFKANRGAEGFSNSLRSGAVRVNSPSTRPRWEKRSTSGNHHSDFFLRAQSHARQASD